MATKSNLGYVAEADKIIKGQYESGKNNLQNNFNKDMYELESQKGEIDKQYTGMVDSAKESGEANKTNYNNATINRGLARSTIATTGIAGIQNTTDKSVVSINTERQSQMNNIAKLKDMLRNNLTNSLSGLQSEYNSNVNSLAMQLRQRAEDVSYRNNQLSQSQSIANSELAYKYEALKQSQSQYESDSKYKYDALKQNQSQSAAELQYKYQALKKQQEEEALSNKYPSSADFKTYLTSMSTQKAVLMLQNNRAELLKNYGASTYNSMLTAVQEKSKDSMSYYTTKYSK